MVSLMQRRREMMRQAAAPTPYWDYEWDVSKGLMESQSGWGLDSSGTGGTALVSDGEKIWTNNSAYRQPYISSSGEMSNLRTMPNGYGTLEVVCYGKWYNTTGKNARNLRITAAESSSYRVTIYPFNGKWRLMKNPSGDTNTAIADCANNTEYTIRIVMKHETADIYINGEKVQSDIDTTQFAAGPSNSVMSQNGGGSSYYGVVKSFKIHLGQ